MSATGERPPPWPVPDARARRVWRAALVVALCVFAGLVMDLLLHGPASAADPAVSRWLAQQRSPELTLAMRAVTQLHGTVGIDLMLAVAVAALAARKEWRLALWLACCVQGAMLLNVLLKVALQRVRPDSAEALVHLTTFSFPSGHALASTVWWGCAVLLCHRWLPRAWRACAGVAVTMVLLTCASRVYLGAHYLTDVAAGVAEGIAWLALWALGMERAMGIEPTS